MIVTIVSISWFDSPISGADYLLQKRGDVIHLLSTMDILVVFQSYLLRFGVFFLVCFWGPKRTPPHVWHLNLRVTIINVHPMGMNIPHRKKYNNSTHQSNYWWLICKTKRPSVLCFGWFNRNILSQRNTFIHLPNPINMYITYKFINISIYIYIYL